MRAVVVEKFGPPEALRIRDTPAPVPDPGEVLVEIHAAPVNYVDMLVVGGVYQFMPTLPFIPGKSPAGIVAAIGPGVTSLVLGDRVLATAEYGGYGEAVTLEADQCHRLPEGLSFSDAAAMGGGFDTSLGGFGRRARVKP